MAIIFMFCRNSFVVRADVVIAKWSMVNTHLRDPPCSFNLVGPTHERSFPLSCAFHSILHDNKLLFCSFYEFRRNFTSSTSNIIYRSE